MEATLPRQANGNFLPPANTAAVTATTISSTAYNTLETDIGTEITNSLDRLGRSAMQAALPMGGNKISGMADPTVATDAATKSYVDTTTSSFFSTGDVKLTIKTVADTGWILLTSGTFGNGTIGSASSSANIRANADCQPLFNLLFSNYSDANAPILTSGGAATTRAAQTNAATAWAANCRIQVGFFAGRALGIAGNPADLQSNRLLGDHIGTDTTTINTSNLTAYTPSGSLSVGAVTFPNVSIASAASGGSNAIATGGFATTANLNAAIAVSQAASSITFNAQGGSSVPFSNYEPTTFINAMVKL